MGRSRPVARSSTATPAKPGCQVDTYAARPLADSPSGTVSPRSDTGTGWCSAARRSGHGGCGQNRVSTGPPAPEPAPGDPAPGRPTARPWPSAPPGPGRRPGPPPTARPRRGCGVAPVPLAGPPEPDPQPAAARPSTAAASTAASARPVRGLPGVATGAEDVDDRTGRQRRVGRHRGRPANAGRAVHGVLVFRNLPGTGVAADIDPVRNGL